VTFRLAIAALLLSHATLSFAQSITQTFRATSEPLPHYHVLTIFADGEERPITRDCVADPLKYPGKACAEFAITGPVGTSKAITLRATNLQTGQHTPLSNVKLAVISTPEPSPQPSRSTTPTPSGTVTRTPSPTVSRTPTPSPTLTRTVSSTATVTPTTTATKSPTPLRTATVTASATPPRTFAPTRTPKATRTRRPRRTPHPRRTAQPRTQENR
jgi:hypothetical protein